MSPAAAPASAGPLSASIVVPGSKSATARGYVLAALAAGPSTLTGVLDARDTRLMRAALQGFGVRFTDLSDGVVRVTPPERFTPHDVHVGLAGTIMRFVPPSPRSPMGPAASTAMSRRTIARSHHCCSACSGLG